MANHIRNLAGVRIGKLVVLEVCASDTKGRTIWSLRCDCGSIVMRKSANIVSAMKNNSPSNCGCSHHLKTHGMSSTHRNLHWVWKAMRARCMTPSNKDFKNYGGRGISICEDWENFAKFAEWAISTGYRRGLTIERIDANGNYEPRNCTWIANEKQALNRRNNHEFAYMGKTQGIRAWADEYGIPYYRLRSRLIAYGWSIERALTT